MRKIFVFGSNREGRHGKGAAKDALLNWGAKYGQAEGLQGDSYAIVTKELRAPSWRNPPVDLEEIRGGVERFLEFAKKNPDWQFIVTPIGTQLAGFAVEDIAPLFAKSPENVVLPAEFTEYFKDELWTLYLKASEQAAGDIRKDTKS